MSGLGSSLRSSADLQVFEQFKLNMTSLLVSLWQAKIFMRAQPPSTDMAPGRLRGDIWRLMEDSIWNFDRLYKKGLNMTGTPSNDTAWHELHQQAHELLHWTHDISLKLQNITQLAEKNLTLTLGASQLANDTWWGSLKHEIGGITEMLQDTRPNDFEQRIHDPSNKLETVVELDDDATKAAGYEHEPALTVMDSRSNKYVLSHPSGIKSLAAHGEDPALVIDLILLLLCAYLLGAAFEYVGLPGFFGNLLAGVLLGPSCLDAIRNVVQLSSIGQIGALLLLLELGREFSYAKLLQFSSITLLGAASFSALCCLTWGLFGKAVLGSGFKESCFIGLVMSFSSTAVSIKCLRQASENAAHGSFLRNSHVEPIITGFLLMQDALFSTVISVLPVLASIGTTSSTNAAIALARFVLKAGLAALSTVLVVVYVVPLMRRVLARGDSSRLQVAEDLTVLLTAFGSVLLCHLIGISGEFGAFFTGLAYSVFGQSMDKFRHSSGTLMAADFEEQGLVKSLSDCFCTVFFASIGLYIDIWFVQAELRVLLCAGLLFVALKLLIMYAQCSGLFRLGLVPSLLISVNLAQVSELAVALGSKGRRLGIISREAYLLFVGSTIFSLLLVPFLWKLALMRVDKDDRPEAEM